MTGTDNSGASCLGRTGYKGTLQGLQEVMGKHEAAWAGRWGYSAAATAAKSPQSCPTLCDPIDGSPPGSPVPGILQARTLEWVAISFSNA